MPPPTHPSPLKARVREHWEAETCGTRYGASADRLAWFRDIARRRYELEPYIPAFARFAEAQGQHVLEIGVGAGSDFLCWCRHARHAHGLDLTDAGVALTTERLTLEGIPPDRFTVRVGDAEALPFPDQAFDLVYSWGVLHHTPDTAHALAEVFRVLKPGGVARTMIYHVPSWTGFMLYLIHGLARGRPFLTQRRAIYECLESAGTKAYTRAEAHALLAAQGFTDIVLSTRLGPGDLLTLEPSARYRSFIYRLAFRLWPRGLIRLIGHRLGLYLLMEARKPR